MLFVAVTWSSSDGIVICFYGWRHVFIPWADGWAWRCVFHWHQWTWPLAKHGSLWPIAGSAGRLSGVCHPGRALAVQRLDACCQECWCTFCRVLHASSSCTWGKVCYLWLLCLNVVICPCTIFEVPNITQSKHRKWSKNLRRVMQPVGNSSSNVQFWVLKASMHYHPRSPISVQMRCQ